MPATLAPDLDLESLLPLRCLVVTLQFTQVSKPNFFHQAALTAFIRFLTGSPENYDQLIRIDTPETGRISYSPGDYYRFMVIGLQGSDEILKILIHKLQKLPQSSPKDAKELPFRNNWKLLDLQDAFSEQSIQTHQELSEYGSLQLQQEIQLWDGQTEIDWSWVSPARMLKEKVQRENLKGEYRYIRDADDITGKLLFSRTHNALADLIRRREGSSSPLDAPDMIQISDMHLFWMDSHYRSAKKESKPMGGVTGRMTLSLPTNLSPFWWKILLLGQYTGIGQRTTFGWGRYQLQTQQNHYSYRRILPASSLLMLAQDEENLSKAWRHVMARQDDFYQTSDIDDYLEEDDEEPPKAPIEKLQKDLNKLLNGEYTAPDLQGHLIPKKSGGVRPLAIPPIYDRVLQRTITQILSPALEQLMYQHSHGYRPGRSRITASYDIQAAWRAGYRWVYESDIKNFFDSVNLDHLRDRLNAIYHGDPLVECIINWMRAPVTFQGQKIERKHGLPQGSPLSPLMANLILDDFDGDMKAAGFHLIRFADDFIVLCKDPAQAEKAELAAKKSLQEHGLELHPDKSHITAIEKGFKYLGYLFVNDMALDVSRSQKEKPTTETTTVPPNSWLANLAEQQPQQLTKQETLTQLIQKIAHKQPIKIADRESGGALLVVTGEHSVVSTLNKQLNVYRNDKCRYKVPWKNLQAVILFGNHQITTQAMHAALRSDTPIHLASGTGHYQGVITHNRNNQHQKLWLRQSIALQDEEKALYCAREIVASRLRHIKEHLRQRQQAHNIPVIESALKNVNRAANLESLRGYEGSATREYYQRLSLVIPAEYGFNGRNRRPPRDPVNVLLSIGYTSLYAYTESFLHTSGLLPWQGFYHQQRGSHAVLASDLMEPFRHLIERTAISLIRRHEIKIDDFSYSATGSCNMTNDARRKYLALLLQRWEIKIKAKGQAEPQTWFKHLQQQNQSLKEFILQGTPFKAFRLR